MHCWSASLSFRCAAILGACTLLLAAGCSSGVTFVDEQGNVLAVNARGQPVLPTQSRPSSPTDNLSRPRQAEVTGPPLGPDQPAHPPAATGYREEPGWVQPTTARTARTADKTGGYWVSGGSFPAQPPSDRGENMRTAPRGRASGAGPDPDAGLPPTGPLPERTFYRVLEFQGRPPMKAAPARVDTSSGLGLPPGG